MPGKSNIQWCTDTWNPTTGCTRVSAGCDNCYAFQLHDQRHEAWKAGRFPDAPPQYHKPFSEMQLIPERLTLPLRWTKPRRIFVDSMSDLFHAEVPDHFISSVFAVMHHAPDHTFQILTKRPQRMQKLLGDPERLWAALPDSMFHVLAGQHRKHGQPEDVWPLPNVWLGTSVENQEAAYRIDWLLKTPAVVRFLSCEPLIGPLNLRDLRRNSFVRVDPLTGRLTAMSGRDEGITDGIDWVITGGESGPGYRPLNLDWVRSIRDQCQDAGVAFFHKQNGGIRSKAGGRELDDRTWDEMPAVAS